MKTWTETGDMEVSGYALDAIRHSCRAVERRRDGLAPVADRHSAACEAALVKLLGETARTMAAASPAAPEGRPTRG